MKVNVSQSVGEVIDRITILSLKSNKASEDPQKKLKIQKELFSLCKDLFSALAETTEVIPLDSVFTLAVDLFEKNAELWDLEDTVRSSTDETKLLEAYKRIPVANDVRCRLKNRISELAGDGCTEYKIYGDKR